MTTQKTEHDFVIRTNDRKRMYCLRYNLGLIWKWGVKSDIFHMSAALLWFSKFPTGIVADSLVFVEAAVAAKVG